jgi:hypothetical protein
LTEPVGPIGRSGQDPAGFEHQWNEWLKLYDKVQVAKIVFESSPRRFTPAGFSLVFAECGAR